MQIPAGTGMFDSISTLAALLGALSISVERVVEVVKGVFPWLGSASANEKIESLRRAAIQVLPIGTGALIAFLAQSQIKSSLPGNISLGFGLYVFLRLLASGGSGVWNHAPISSGPSR